MDDQDVITSPTALKPHFITVDEVAEQLGLSRLAVLRAIKRGTIPEPDFSLSRKSRRWRRDTFERWLNRGAHHVTR